MFFVDPNDFASNETFALLSSFIWEILKLLNLMRGNQDTLKFGQTNNFLQKRSPDESEIVFEEWEDEGVIAPS